MNSDLPIVLYKVKNKTMIEHVISRTKKLNPEILIVFVGYKYDIVKQYLNDYEIDYALQKEQNGTAHAVIQCKNQLKNFNGNVLVISGDVPFISYETLQKLIKTHEKSNSKATVLTCELNNPYGYGRIIKNKNNTL